MFFGQILSALMGVVLYVLIGCTWLSLALGVILAIVVMVLTDTSILREALP